MGMRFRAHDTFFIRKGWLSKGMKYVKRQPDVFVCKEEKPMDILGIGSNMVKSLRYWLQTVGLTKEPKSGKRLQSFTDFGESVFNNDRYIEELGTLYLLQYNLAKNIDEATSWYFFFNKFFMSEFTKDDFINALQNYININGEQVSIRSLTDDFNCIINTYIPRYKLSSTEVSPENNIDCPLGELGLIDIVGKQQNLSGKTEILYKKSVPSIKSIDPWVALAVIVDNAKDNKTIALNELLTAKNNIGRVFNLDSVTMLDLLHNIEKTGEIKIIRTAGLDIIKIINNHTFQECVNIYYENLAQKY